MSKDKTEAEEQTEAKPKGMGILEGLMAKKKAQAERRLLEFQEELRKKQAAEAERKKKAEERKAREAEEEAKRKVEEEAKRKAREEAQKIANQKRRAEILEQNEMQYKYASFCLDAVKELKEANAKYHFYYFGIYMDDSRRALENFESGLEHMKADAERILMDLEREYERLGI